MNKEPISVIKEQIIKAQKCLEDNGIAKDETGTVLQALGYILCDEEWGDLIEEEDPKKNWTKEMNRCADCFYLVEDEEGNWVCDDCQKEIHKIPDEECSAEQDW